MKTFESLESQVRLYIREFPTVFDTAKDARLYDENGKEYIDFFAGSGALNYGHNNKKIKTALIDYLQRDGILLSLDLATTAKRELLNRLKSIILSPRNMDYKIQFTGPTGTNAVEAAVKLARLATKRSNIIAFTGAFHGLTMGSLALTANSHARNNAYVNRSNVVFMPYDGYFGPGVNTIEYLRTFLEDNDSGIDLPAAIILETIQADGGVNVASDKWLTDLERVCRKFDILLIIDDIQVGNGRTGKFFSFEHTGIKPDIIVVSKSLGGGLPLSLVLIKPGLDQWKPGEHTGTFRGNSLAFVASAETLNYWKDKGFADSIGVKSEIMKEKLENIKRDYKELSIKTRGRGLIFGFELPDAELASKISSEAFRNGLLIEVVGGKKNVLKLLPPLIIEEDDLKKGLETLGQSIGSVLNRAG